MPWRPHGKARVSASKPEAFAICDGCGAMRNRVDLRYQTVRTGNQLTMTRKAVCVRCIDTPRPPSTIRIEPDGQPIKNARPEAQRAPYPDGAN